MLKITNLSKSYKSDKKAVDSLNLEVNAGDIYGFIGHNGAGKTTTIRAVVGVLDFEEGEITIDGISIKKDPVACKQKMAYIPDNPDLYEHLSGIAYLNFIGDIYQVGKQERKELIQKYADAFELTSNLGDTISSYSHGMKQKLAIISALIHKPRLLVLDEPFVGLDPKASYTLKNIMADLCENGSAIFFSTHVLEVAEKLCNKIAIIKGGKLVSCGTTEEVKGNSSLEDVFMELIDQQTGSAVNVNGRA
jgi:ABC-2 type transport system ATP-binding protein